ncbi:hypothetical protein PCANC_15903 [Puccinia coronata f. sp. avenae]|uniref:Uncharacterized protein n=1 Tax=Puccinia coronata f. sp. avenae TaxID=200324 RepID=A0A2N5UMC6_9BASI|nr:hypothetical protein PCANC_15903 [Puccinia coronata f. sp. avenae]
MAQPPSNSGIQQTYTWRQQLSNQIGFARQPPSFCRSAQHPTVLAPINSCQELKIKVDSLDCVAIEGILVDVFMKYTLQFWRTCLSEAVLSRRHRLLIKQQILTAGEWGKLGIAPPQAGHTMREAARCLKPERTLPYDTTLKEQVIRQQYALYEAKVKDTRKQKDFPTHIIQRVEAAAYQSLQHNYLING